MSLQSDLIELQSLLAIMIQNLLGQQQSMELIQVTLACYGRKLKKSKKKLSNIEKNRIQQNIKGLESIKNGQYSINLMNQQKREQLLKDILKEYYQFLQLLLADQLLQLIQQLRVEKRLLSFSLEYAPSKQNIHQSIQSTASFFKQLKKLIQKYLQKITKPKNMTTIQDYKDNALINLLLKSADNMQVDSIYLKQIVLCSLLQELKVATLQVDINNWQFTYSKQIFPKFTYNGNKQFSQIKIDGLPSMLKNSQLQSLKQLKLQQIPIDTNSIKILSMCQLNCLLSLSIKSKIKNKGVEYLVKTNWPKLKILSLGLQCGITNDVLKLFTKFMWPSLKQIVVQTLGGRFNDKQKNIYWREDTKSSFKDLAYRKIRSEKFHCF